MDVNTFYELRMRLYAAAAAGCSLIEEDFRLKRAIEAFKPISEANKVFGRLYQMCESLFTSDNVASVLTDCIALADALAVTQGSFMDKSECEEKEDNIQLQPQTMSHSTIQDYKTALLSGKERALDFTQKDLKRFLEPRIFPTFIQSLQRNEEVYEDMAEYLLLPIKENIADFLKEQVNLQDTSVKNKTAYYVKLISRLYGVEENDWYISLIERENVPKSVRVAAIHALSCSEDNIPKLLDLYHTQKGDIKKAAAHVLAYMDSTETDELWEKMAKKYKSNYDEFVNVSRSDVWVTYIREKFEEFLVEMEKYENGQSELDENQIFIQTNWFVYKGFARKYQLEDVFVKFAEKYEWFAKFSTTHWYSPNWKADMNMVLINNLIEDDERYADLIKQVYEKQKDFYLPARFVLALKENGEQAFEDYKEEIRQDREGILERLTQITYNNILGGYYLTIGSEPQFTERGFQKIKVFNEYPEYVISYVTELDYFSEEVDGKRIFNGANMNETIRRASMALLPERLHIKPESKDYEKCVEAAVSFSLEVNRIHSILFEIIHVLAPYYENGTVEDYIQIAENYEMQCLLDENAEMGTRALHELDKFPISDEEKAKGLLTIKSHVEQVKNVSEKKKKKLMDEIDRMLKQRYSAYL